MSSSQENIPPDGVGDGRSNLPAVPNYDEEKLAAVMEAMLEELGNARKDTLPLEDGRRSAKHRETSPISRATTVKRARRPVHPGVAAWQDFQPDDVTDADRELDSIADGQLARLRRGNASGMTGARGGRGRGGAAARGGHSFTSGRSQSDRGERGSMTNAYPSGRSSVSTTSLPTPQSYFNDKRSYTPLVANMAVRYPAQLDATIARLRSSPSEQNLGKAHIPSPTATLSGISSALPASSVVVPEKTHQRWGDGLDPSAFLKFVGLSNAGKKPSQSVAPTPAESSGMFGQPLAPTQQSHAPESMASIVLPKATEMVSPPAADSAPLRCPIPEQGPGSLIHTSTSNMMVEVRSETDPTPSGNFLPHGAARKGVGLAHSIWATAPAAHMVSPQLDIESAKTMASESVEQRGYSQVVRETFVKFQKDDETLTEASARLVKNVKLDKDLTLELIKGHKVLFREIVDRQSVFLHKIGTSVITYRKEGEKDTAAPTWTLVFQVPYQAKKFHDLVFSNRQGHPTSRPAARRLPADAVPAPRELPAPSKDDTLFALPPLIACETEDMKTPLESNESKKSSVDMEPTSTPETPSYISTGLEAITSPTDTQSNLPSPLVFELANLMEQEPIDLGQFALQNSDSQKKTSSFGNYIHSQTLNDMAQIAGFTPLISLIEEGESVPQLSNATSSTDDLKLLYDDTMSKSTFDYLNNSPHGSLLSQLSRRAVRKGGSAAQELTGEEILTSELYINVAYDLVSNFLSGSETFSRMPDHTSTNFMKWQTRKVLELAVADREGSVVAIVPTQDPAKPSSIEKDAFTPEMSVNLTQAPLDSSSCTPGAAAEIVAGRKVSEVVAENDANVSPIPFATSRITKALHDTMQFRETADLLERDPLSHNVSPLARSHMPPSKTVGATLTSARSEALLHLSSQVENNQVTALVSLALQAPITMDSESNSAKNSQMQQRDMSLWYSRLSISNHVDSPMIKSGETPQSAQTSGLTQPALSVNEPSAACSDAIYQRSADVDNLPEHLDGFCLTVPSSTLASPSEEVTKIPNNHKPKSKLMEANILSNLSSPKSSFPMSPHVTASSRAKLSLTPSLLPVKHSRLQSIDDVHLPLIPACLPVEVAGARIRTPNTTASNEILAAKLNHQAPVFNLPDLVHQHKQESHKSDIAQPGTSGPTLAPIVAPSGVSANIHMATNTDLKGMPGLGASRWSSPPAPAPLLASRSMAPQHNPRVGPFPPVNLGYRGGISDAPQVIANSPSNPPILPCIPGTAPVYSTVVFQDSNGSYREVTGMVKTGSVPIVAYMPVPDAMHTTSSPSDFPARPSMYNRPMSNEFDGTDHHFKPDPAPFRPSSRVDNGHNASHGNRTALSPVRQGKNVQAMLQSRLDNSLAYRGPLSPS